MRHVKHWTVDIYIDEEGRVTHADARLHTQDTDTMKGTGESRLHPGDVNVPEIGDEYAVGRALVDLGHKLINAATEDVEATSPGRTPSVPYDLGDRPGSRGIAHAT